MTPRDVLTRRLRVILAIASVTCLLVWAVGSAARGFVLGPDVAAARLNVEKAVRAAVAAEVAAAARHATAVDALVAGTPAFETDTQALRRLFDALADRVDEDAGTEATTILDADAVPLAWAGRPSDIPVDRVRRATEDWFALEWALGLRARPRAPADRTAGPRPGHRTQSRLGWRAHHARPACRVPAPPATGWRRSGSRHPSKCRPPTAGPARIPRGCASTAPPAGRS